MATRIMEALIFAVLILYSIFSCPTLAISTGLPHETKEIPKRHDYKLTFKKPYYYNNTVPFFDTFGKTLLAPDFIRLAPDVPDHSGSIWSQLTNPHKEWEVEMSFRISGNYYLGGRGITFWYTKERAKEGPVYGSSDKWTGLAIMFETADHKKNREHPFIMAHLNDGNTVYNELANPQERMLAGCYRLFRNTPSPVFARISYFNNTLKLEVDANDDGTVYHPCFEVNVTLPTGYYFGVSALAEGDTPDDHDVLSFTTYELNPAKKRDRPLRPHEAEKSSKVSADTYEIPEDVKKRIEDIQKVVSKPEETKDREDTRSVDFIKGMQIQILESLDQLHERLNVINGIQGDYYYSGSSKTEIHLSAISKKLEKVINNVASLETRISRMSAGGSVSNDYSIRELKEDLQRMVRKIESLDARIATQRYNQDFTRKRESDQSHANST
ncbi:1639_t:CDS:10, partial [Acaulospora morrowiae]